MRGCGVFCALQGLHRCDAGVDRIAIIGAAAPIQLAVFVNRGPRAKVIAPAVELGLLVQVAIHQHRLARTIAGRTRGGDLKKHDRCAPRQLDDFERQSIYFLRFDPLRGPVQYGGDVAVGGPVGIECR